MTPVRALVFDLYGTLLHLRDSAFQKGIVRLVEAPRREWIDFLRRDLAVRGYADDEAFVDAILRRFPPRGEAVETRRAALDLLARELASAAPEPAARSVLGFLKRRGLKLALLTNSGSPFRAPFESAGWRELFDVVVFSCDLGTKKPDPSAYREVLGRLGVEPGEALMIGDSLANDVRAPAELGLRTLRVGGGGESAVAEFGDLAWLTGLDGGPTGTLVSTGARLEFGGLAGTVARLDLLPDSSQGRYNLVATADVTWDDGLLERIYLKRFRHPEAVYVEQFIRRLLGEVGIATNRVAVVGGREPLLAARAITGEKLDRPPFDADMASEYGRHGCSAWLFANADLRPRNAFLTRLGGRPRLTMVDYEYSLFDRALDLSDLPERYDPRALARRPEAELLARGSRRVVTAGAIQRTRRAFFDHRGAPPEVMAAFRAGWYEVHEAAQAAAGRIEELLLERLGQDPPLIVGTEAYRRAFLPLDVRDLLDRIALDPRPACEQSL